LLTVVNGCSCNKIIKLWKQCFSFCSFIDIKVPSNCV
jgi:hypothetical protein